MRFFEIVTSTLLIITTSPLLLIVACAIKLEDRGPVFYTQERIGHANRVFRLFKFRSMIDGAEKQGEQWAGKTDSRITHVGRIIRKLHIDELPQMINILKGELALVGPRPERPGFVRMLEEAIPHYHLRHIIKPGFTGWAQIRHHYARSIEDSHRKFEYDLYYIKNRNLFLDFGIMLKTIQIIVTHK